MPKWSSTVGTALLILPLIAAAYTNEPKGFRGITWGSEFVAHAAEMTMASKDKDTTFYLRKGDKLSIGGAELTDITYVYRHGKFQGVVIRSSGRANKSALIAAFREQFGRPDQPNQFVDEYNWRGPISIILLDCASIVDTCNATLVSTQGFNQQQEVERKAAAGAKKDF